jgi:hypothetical protein
MPLTFLDNSGLGGGFCRLGEVKLSHVKHRFGNQGEILSSGPSLYGLGQMGAALGTLQLSGWPGSIRISPYDAVSSTLKTRIYCFDNVSGQNVGASRYWRFLCYDSVNQYLKTRNLTYDAVNPPKTALDTLPPFYGAISTNNKEYDLDAPTIKIGNPKTGQYTDISGIPYQFVVSMSESQPSNWTLYIYDKGKYSPLKIGSIYQDLMDEKPFGPSGPWQNSAYPQGLYYPPSANYSAISSDSDPGNSSSETQQTEYITQVRLDIVKEMSFTSYVGRKPWTFRGIGTKFTHNRDWVKKAFEFQWSGQDYSILLNKENQNMQTIRSGGNSPLGHTFYSAVQQMLSTYGVRHDLSALTLPGNNHQIPFMNRTKGKPMDWIYQILNAVLLEWHMENGIIFKPYMPVPLMGTKPYIYDMDSVSPHFVYDLSQVICYDETISGEMNNMYNLIVAIRAAQGGGQKYEVEAFNFGDSYSVSFNPPLSGISYRPIYANNGRFSDFKFYRGDKLVAVTDVTSGSINWGQNVLSGGMLVGIDRVDFTWGVLPGGFIGLGAPGKIQFTGTPEPDDKSWGGSLFGTAVDQGPANPAPQLRAFAENRNLIYKYGLRSIEISASSLLPHLGALQEFAHRMLFKMSRNARSISRKVALNPEIRPGSIIREIDYTLGSLAVPFVRDVVVNTCSHSFSDEPQNRYTTYAGNEYTKER